MDTFVFHLRTAASWRVEESELLLGEKRFNLEEKKKKNSTSYPVTLKGFRYIVSFYVPLL